MHISLSVTDLICVTILLWGAVFSVFYPCQAATTHTIFSYFTIHHSFYILIAPCAVLYCTDVRYDVHTWCISGELLLHSPRGARWLLWPQMRHLVTGTYVPSLAVRYHWLSLLTSTNLHLRFLSMSPLNLFLLSSLLLSSPILTSPHLTSLHFTSPLLFPSPYRAYYATCSYPVLRPSMVPL